MRYFLFVLLFVFSTQSFAEDLLIANCSNPIGQAYFHHYGIVPEDGSGWDKDGFESVNATFSLKKLGENKYDILFIDATKSIKSSTQEGAKIFPVIITNTSITMVIIYPQEIVETYSFWTNAKGKNKFAISQSKTGDILLRKNSLMVGDCSYINYDAL